MYAVPLILIPSYIILYLNNFFLCAMNLFIFNVILYEFFSNIYYHFKNINILINKIYYIINYFCFLILLTPFMGSYLLISNKNIDIDRIILFNFYALIVISDTLQLFFGKNNIIPILNNKPFTYISPNKTLAGYIFGFFFTYLINYYFLFINNAVILLFLGIIGDLYASYIKRFLNIKDYSKLLGSHGGFLDRFDSLIFSAPFFFYFNNELYY